MEIRAMRPSELELALDWAAAEGWNPGRHDAAGAEALLDALVAGLDGPHWVDVHEANAAGTALVRRRGMAPVFRTARMHRSRPPAYDRGLVFGVTTLELG